MYMYIHATAAADVIMQISIIFSFFFWPSHARRFFRGEEEEENFHSIVTSLTINKMVAAIFDAQSGSTQDIQWQSP